jgi:hypothetical protein
MGLEPTYTVELKILGSLHSVFVATSTLSAGVSFLISQAALSSTFSYETGGADPGIEQFELFDHTLISIITFV